MSLRSRGLASDGDPLLTAATHGRSSAVLPGHSLLGSRGASEQCSFSCLDVGHSLTRPDGYGVGESPLRGPAPPQPPEGREVVPGSAARQHC